MIISSQERKNCVNYTFKEYLLKQKNKNKNNHINKKNKNTLEIFLAELSKLYFASNTQSEKKSVRCIRFLIKNILTEFLIAKIDALIFFISFALAAAKGKSILKQ